MDFLRNWVENNPVSESLSLEKVGESLLLLLTLFIIQKLTGKMLEKRSRRIEKVYEWKKIARYIIGTIGIFVFLRIWFEGFQSLITFLGILSAGIAIALKDFIANMVGWIFIVSRNPFNVGDRIQIGDISGDVVDIRLFQFTLLEIGNWVDSDQSTGRLIHVPNGRVFQTPQANYTQSFKYIWNEISTCITFESDHVKAKKILLKVLNKIALPMTEGAEEEFEEARKRFLIIHGTISPQVYIKVIDQGVELLLRYLVPARKRRDSENDLWEEILRIFNKEKNIQFAYPTTRFYSEKQKQIKL
ncbi:MAG: mechanosensitive ion channel domain-containing protein [Leptospirales bacterium]